MNLARYDGFAHLCSALCVGEDDFVAVLTAYFDESGTDETKPAVSVGCYLATEAQWKCFNRDWKWLLDWSGIKSYFHRTDQESFWLHEETKDWDREKQITVYQAQHAFIHAYTLRGFAGTVIKTEYDEAIVGADRQAVGDAYEFCLRHCLAGIARFLVDRPTDEIVYVIESGADEEKHLGRAFDLFLTDPECKQMFRLKQRDSWAFVSKERAIPLQAADALAFEVAKEMESRFGPIKRSTRKSFLDLFRGRETDEIAWWPRSKLINVAKMARAEAELEWAQRKG
jgi:Protein of unknown function (DUF3800)